MASVRLCLHNVELTAQGVPDPLYIFNLGKEEEKEEKEKVFGELPHAVRKLVQYGGPLCSISDVTLGVGVREGKRNVCNGCMELVSFLLHDCLVYGSTCHSN